MPAMLKAHTYLDGYGRESHDRSFWTVECQECLVVLNSGHHYTGDVIHHAEALRDEHNAAHHHGRP